MARAKTNSGKKGAGHRPEIGEAAQAMIAVINKKPRLNQYEIQVVRILTGTVEWSGYNGQTESSD